jgi:hypothetical protein
MWYRIKALGYQLIHTHYLRRVAVEGCHPFAGSMQLIMNPNQGSHPFAGSVEGLLPFAGSMQIIMNQDHKTVERGSFQQKFSKGKFKIP